MVTPTPVPTAAPTLPPIGFNHRYGNSPVAAGDGFDLERQLFAGKQFWEAALATRPERSGYVDRSDPAAVTAARAGASQLIMVFATEALATVRGFLAPGDDGQRQYLIDRVEALRAKGYSGLKSVTFYVYFGETHRHSELDWTPAAGYTYRIFDNNSLGITLPSATPFQSLPGLPTDTPAASTAPPASSTTTVTGTATG